MPRPRTATYDASMKIDSTRAAAAIAGTMLALAACDRATTEEVRAEGREAGQRLENAADRTQQRLAEFGDRMAPKLAEVTEKTKEQLAVAGEKTHQALSGAADKVDRSVNAKEPEASRPDRDAGMGDTAITASIKASLVKDPDLSALKIDVDTRGGVVSLNGLAPNAEARDRATKIAEGTKGVREVRNHLTLKQG